VTRDYWIYDRNTATLTLPNGTRYIFGRAGIVGGDTQVAYATQITDAFGNTVTIAYLTGASDPSEAISSVTQNVGGRTRQVTFGVGTSNKSVASMTFQGRTWTYTQASSANVGNSFLTEVRPPVGPGWRHADNTSTAPRFELTGITTPNGGQITYTYGDQVFHLGTTYPVRSRAVVQRVIGGRDIMPGTWAYRYQQGSAHNQTVITGPCNAETYTFLGVGNNSPQGPVWSIGLQASRVLATSGVTLEFEQLTWIASSPISNDQQIVGLNHDSFIYVPLVSTRTVVRGPSTFSTTNTYSASNFNDYGRPNVVSESGQLSRTTSRMFRYGFSKYIVDKVASETVTVGGESFAKSYTYNLSNGFPQSQTVDGVTTSFVGDSRGNVSASTDARANTTLFAYQWGRISSVQTPQYTISRPINGDGTVASETRRGFATTFSYDALERLTRTVLPVGNAITTTYDNSAGVSLTNK
jgi:YD repeat-containing protein